MPDFIFKAAAEPGFGHYEVFGILSRFRDRVYPCGEPAVSSNCNGAISALGAYNNSVTVGGVGANARVTFRKQLDFGLHALMGEGMGRYGTGGLPDSTVHADGTLAPLRSYQGLATLEWHTKRLDLYLNGGEEYVARRWQFDPNNPTQPIYPGGIWIAAVQCCRLLFRRLRPQCGHRLHLRIAFQVQRRYAIPARRHCGILDQGA